MTRGALRAMTTATERVRRLVALYAPPIAWSAYLLLRAPDWGVLQGVPIGPLGLAALFCVWWVWAIEGTLPGLKWVGLLLLLKFAVSPLLVPRGLHASYFANESRQGTPERGLYGSWPDETRVDASLAFQRWTDFPFYFLNERRFNRPDAIHEPVSMEWTGYLSFGTGEREFYLSGEGISADLLIDGIPVASLASTEHEATGRVSTRSGLRLVTIHAAGPSGIPTAFEAGLIDPATGDRRPLDRSMIVADRVTPKRLLIDRILVPVTTACDLGLLVVLAAAVANGIRRTVRTSSSHGWPHAIGRLLPLLACAEAMWFAQHTRGQMEIMGWGSDRLTYEAFARDILFSGPLMTLGAQIGQGAPFYYQPLYPYFLSMAHLLGGEPLWVVYVLQRLGLALVVYAIWGVARTLMDGRTAVVALVLGVWFAYVRLELLSTRLYNESLFVPLLCLWMYWLCRDAVMPGTGHVLRGALAGGLAALTRTTLLAAVPPVAGILVLAYRRHRRPLTRLMGAGALLVLVVGLATTRNWVVSRLFVAVTTSFGINLRLGNEATSLVLPPNDRHPLMDRINTDASTRAVLEYAYHLPGPFVQGLLTKAAYVLGVESLVGVVRPKAYATTIPINRTLPWIWVASLAGVWLLWRRDNRTGTLRLAQAIPAVIALTHFVSIIVIFPYSERLVLPFYALILVYAAVPIGALASQIPVRLGSSRG